MSEIPTETQEEAVEMEILAQLGILCGDGANELREQNRAVLSDLPKRSVITSW